MNLAKKAPGVVGFALLVVLGSIVFGVAAAQAQETRVLGAKLSTESETVTGTPHSESINLLVPAQNLKILCNKYTIQEGLVFKNGSGQGKISLTACGTTQNGKSSPGCTPIEPVVGSGKGKLILHGGRTYLLGEPLTVGGAYAILKFNEETCALPAETAITGTTVGECITSELKAGLCETEEVTHLVQPAPAALFPTDALSFGKSPVVPDGIVAVKLAGKNAGCKWSGVI